VSGSSSTVIGLPSMSSMSSEWTDDGGSSTESADDGSSTVVSATLEPVLSTGSAESLMESADDGS
jgi:hypothetical protein